MFFSHCSDLRLRFYTTLRMSIPFLVMTCVISNLTFAQRQESLSLDQAITKTLAHNPQLHQFTVKKAGLLGRREISEQRPALNIVIDVENMAGRGELSGMNAAETTLSLSSVIELGSKRRARISVVTAQLEALDYHRQAFTLDVLGELTGTFVRALEIQELVNLGKEAYDLSVNTLAIVKSRAQQGATPESEVQRAVAALTQAQLRVNGLQHQRERLFVRLASYWGERSPTWNQVVGDLYTVSESTSYESLYDRAQASPTIALFATETRLKKAEVSLAKAHSTSDLGWQLGVRRFEESGDTAFIAGVSIPLFGGKRNRGAVKSALSAQNEVEYERQTALLKLHVQLFDAYSQRQQHVAAVNAFRTTILPDLTSVLAATQHAYETGRYSYQDWIAAQNELLNAKQFYIENAAAASLDQAIIEQLIAEPFIAKPFVAEPLNSSGQHFD